MEFSANKDELVRELGLIQGIVERKNTIPIMSNVLIEADGNGIELAATDLDVGLRCRLAAEVRKPGALTLSAKKLFEIVRAVDDRNVELKELENSWAAITSGLVFKMVDSKSEFFTHEPPPRVSPPSPGRPERPHSQDELRHHRRRQPLFLEWREARAHGH
jgi:DNA polymerase-3 subunit beta